MPRQVALALVVAARFGLLLALAAWLGVALATLAFTPVLYARLEKTQAHEVAGALFQRADRLMFGAMGLLVLALGSRVVLDRAAPPGSLLLPVAGMVASRLVAGLVVRPAAGALRTRLRDANAPATDAERGAFGRLHGATLMLVALEACLALYALFAVS